MRALWCCSVSLCLTLNPDGTLVQAPDVSCTSTEYVLITPAEYAVLQQPFLNATPDWNQVLWAFGATLTLWCIGLGVGAIVALMRRAR